MYNSSALPSCIGLLLVCCRAGALTPQLWLTCFYQIVAASRDMSWVWRQHCGLCCRTGASYSMADLERVAAGQARNIILLDAGEEVGFTAAVLPVCLLHLKVQQGRAACATMARCFHAAVLGTSCVHAFAWASILASLHDRFMLSSHASSLYRMLGRNRWRLCWAFRARGLPPDPAPSCALPSRISPCR